MKLLTLAFVCEPLKAVCGMSCWLSGFRSWDRHYPLITASVIDNIELFSITNLLFWCGGLVSLLSPGRVSKHVRQVQTRLALRLLTGSKK